MITNARQDRNGVRTPVDVDRRYNRVPKDVEKVKEVVEQFEVDTELSTSSINPVQNKVVTNALNNRVVKEAGKTLSTNDFTNDYMEKLDMTSIFTEKEKTKLEDIEEKAQVNVLEKVFIAGEELTPTNKGVNIYVDSYTSKYSTNPVQNKAITTYVDSKLGSTSYSASSYAASGVSILRSNLELKNDRVVFNFVGTKSMSANTTTTLFNLPAALRPSETRDFVVFGQSSNNDGYVGYGYVTSDGLLQVRFNEAISSYIRFTAVYDL